MTPPGNGDPKRISAPPMGVVPPTEGSPSPPPSSVDSSDPARSRYSQSPHAQIRTRPQGSSLSHIPQGRPASPRQPPFPQLVESLDLMANPHPNGGYEATYTDSSKARKFHILQEGPGKPIQMTVWGPIPAGNRGETVQGEIIRMTYHPDGTVSSTQVKHKGDKIGENIQRPPRPFRHMEGPESTYNRRILTLLNSRINTLHSSWQDMDRMQRLLREFKGKYNPSNRSISYDEFATLGKRVYSFRIPDLGFRDIKTDTSQMQIEIYEETGSERRRVLTLSETGEANYEPGPRAKNIPDFAARELVEKLITQLEEAQSNPKRYEGRLHRRVKAILGKDFIPPKIEPSFGQPISARVSVHPRAGNSTRVSNLSEFWKIIRPGHPGIPVTDPNRPGSIGEVPLHPKLRMALVLNRTFWAANAFREALGVVAGSVAKLEIPSLGEIRPRFGSLLLNVQPSGTGDFSTYVEDGRLLNATRITEAGKTIRMGPPLPGTSITQQGQVQIDIRDGQTLRKVIRPFSHGHFWENPQNTNEFKEIRPRWSLRWPMYFEGARWFGSAFRHGNLEQIKNLQPRAGAMMLHLEPHGGGELTIYRGNSEIHDIVKVSEDGTKTSLGREAKRMRGGGLFTRLGKRITFRGKASEQDFRKLPRSEQLQKAAENLRTNSSLPWDIQLQEIKPLLVEDLQRLGHQPETAGYRVDASTGTFPIRDVNTAWEMIRRLPQLQGVRMVPQEIPQGTPLEELVNVNAKPKLLKVLFPGSRSPVNLLIRETMVPSGPNDRVPRIDIYYSHGEDMIAVAYKDGKLAPELARENLRAFIEESMQGKVRRSGLRVFLNGYTRFQAGLKFHGGNYVLGHLGSIPVGLGFEQLYLTEGERAAIGTPGAGLGLNDLFHGLGMALTMVGTGGVFSYWTDSVCNMGVWAREIRNLKSKGATFRQAANRNPFLFNNPSSSIRPIGTAKFGLFRSLVQHTLPLAAGVGAIELVDQGFDKEKIRYDWENMTVDFSGSIDLSKFNSQRFYDSFKKIGTITAITGTGWWAAQYSPWGQSVAKGATQSKWLTTSGTGIGSTRVGLTFRANFWTTIASFAALRIWDTIDRKEQLLESGNGLRNEVVYALNRHNEYLTRLENGEDIPPEKLAGASLALKQAGAQYRKFMEMLDHHEGEGEFNVLSMDNDFQDEYDRLQREQGWLTGGLPGGSPSRLLADHQQRLAALRSRETRLQARLDRLHGGSSQTSPGIGEKPESMKEFMARKLQGGLDPENQSTPANSPVDLDHFQTQVILRDFRQKAARDSGFTQWSREEKAQYILDEFTGFRVTEPDGSRRPWNLAEAKAFLHMIDVENLNRQSNLEETLTQPNSGFDSEKLVALAAKEEQIYREERKYNHHISGNLGRLEDNISDFDRQMTDYHQRAETRLHRALRHFVPGQALAMNI